MEIATSRRTFPGYADTIHGLITMILAGGRCQFF